MNILAECWEEFATPTVLINAAKRVGISSEGLNVKWMNQAMFQRDAALLTPPTPMESSSASSASQSTFDLPSPSKEKNIHKYSVTWYQHKLKESQMEIDRLRNTPLSPNTVEGLMPMKKIESKKSKNIRLAQTHGSMRLKDMLTKVYEKNAAEEEKQKKKDDVEKNKEEIRAAFDICKESCACDGVCVVKGLKQCPVCLNILKSQCSTSSCTGENGQKPKMIAPSYSSKRRSNKVKRILNLAEESVDSDFDDDVSDFDDDVSDFDDDVSDFDDDVSNNDDDVSDNDASDDVVSDNDNDEDRTIGMECSPSAVSGEPMDFNEVEIGMWVVAVYEMERFLGKVIAKKVGKFNVHCLEKPFGINTPQFFENDEDVWYDKVYNIHRQTQIDADGNKCRKWFWVY